MSLFADIDVETLVKEMTDDTTVAETVPSDNTTGDNIPDADKKMAALMMYVSTKTSAVQFVRKWMIFIESIMGTDVLAQYKPQLAAAEQVLGTFVNSNMTAVMSSDGLLITIGGENNNKIEFTYSVTATAQSSDVPNWFVSLYPVISSLLNGTSGDNTAAIAMGYLTQNYPGTAKLSQAIAAAMQQVVSNTGN
jgi:Holliday junction resolvasome RuvABC endonuclease subunit